MKADGSWWLIFKVVFYSYLGFFSIDCEIFSRVFRVIKLGVKSLQLSSQCAWLGYYYFRSISARCWCWFALYPAFDKALQVSYYFFFGYSAARTKNYSGAELEGVVKSAVSFALNRQVSMDDLTKPVDEENIKVTMDDFLSALLEIVPAFGASTDDLERCRWFVPFKLVQISVLWLQDVDFCSVWIQIYYNSPSRNTYLLFLISFPELFHMI